MYVRTKSCIISYVHLKLLVLVLKFIYIYISTYFQILIIKGFSPLSNLLNNNEHFLNSNQCINGLNLVSNSTVE